MFQEGDEHPEGSEVWFLNRTVVVVRHREAFRNWARNVDEGAAGAYDAEGGWTEAYLIPEFEEEQDAWAWLRSEFQVIFEMQLGSWWDDPEGWPEVRSWELFQEWFDVELVGTAWDLVDGPLSSAPPEVEPGSAH